MKSNSISVVVLNNHCNAQGGASRVAIDEAIDLANGGADVTFLGAVGPICDELQNARLKVICLNQSELVNANGRPAVMLQGLWNARAHRTMGSILRSLDPKRTIIHVHGFTQALSTSPIRCALDRAFKVVYTMHDFFSACPTGTFFDFSSSTICPRRALSLDCVTTNCDKRSYAHKLYRVARSSVQLQFGGLPRDVKHYISLSLRSAEVLSPYLPPDARVYPLQNPVGIDKKPAVLVNKNSKIIVVGRLDPEKGIKVLIEAARISRTQLTLIGDGPMRAVAEASGMCRVTGWLSRAAVSSELETARCLVFPSLWYETYGLAVDEAASRGVPAIVSDVSAAAERVENNVTGWHTRSGDVVDLTRCLNLAKDDDAVQSAGDSAFLRLWSNPPTRDRHIAGLLEVYTEILRTGS
jgi:glycosyltransferase involved in cell wall biosynthesis